MNYLGVLFGHSTNNNRDKRSTPSTPSLHSHWTGLFCWSFTISVLNLNILYLVKLLTLSLPIYIRGTRIGDTYNKYRLPLILFSCYVSFSISTSSLSNFRRSFIKLNRSRTSHTFPEMRSLTEWSDLSSMIYTEVTVRPLKQKLYYPSIFDYIKAINRDWVRV